MIETKINKYIARLAEYEGENVWNPWSDYHTDYDISENAPNIRREHLKQYLLPRIGKAKNMILAEAIGYQGGHFSGIAMTCERMLLGNHKTVSVDSIFSHEYKPTLMRTSNPKSKFITKRTQRELGFNEPTDTVVWGAILENKLNPFEFLLWNIFPFHPYKDGNLLSNRTPTPAELRLGWTYTKELLEINPVNIVLAVGQKSENTLKEFGVRAVGLRHPANGGATLYRKGFIEAIQL